MDKVIPIGDKEMGFRATALTPKLYRHLIGRDIVQDMNQLRKSYAKMMNLPETATDEERQDAQLSVIDLEIFENVAYIMARQYDQNTPKTSDEWLDGIDGVFSIYEILPHILELWAINNHTTAKPKKK